MLQRMEMVNTWIELRRALESQFGPSLFDCSMAELSKLQQKGTVADYYLKFMSLAHRSDGLTPEALLNCFISRLNKDIRRDVVAQAPNCMRRSMLQCLLLVLLHFHLDTQTCLLLILIIMSKKIQ